MQLKKSLALRSGIASASLALLMGAATLFAPAAAAAGWSQETLSNHSSWIYEPTKTLASGKRALMVVLHGCDQTHDQLKVWGNLQAAADEKGAVIVVPWVGSKPWPLFASTKCWNYDGATDGSAHVAELVQLTKTLVDRSSLNIDPRHVYMSGMSSGASVAMLAACKAPDLIAGVAAVAGPSVGSNQMQAISDNPTSPTPEAAAAKCKSLAGTANLAHFNTQIANIGYGEMDRNAERPGCSYSSGDTRCPGTYLLVSKGWSTINANMYRLVYGTGALGTAVKVNNNAKPEAEYMGEHREAQVGAQTALSLTRVYNVGHAWPAGSGDANSASKGGVWVAQKGMNYGQYALSWLIANNRRDTGTPEIACQVVRYGDTGFTVSAQATDSDGTIVSYRVKATGPQDINEVFAGGASMSKTYAPVADGIYSVEVTATDNDNKTAVCPASVDAGKVLPPSPPVITLPVESTKDSVTLRWNAVKGATSYKVYRADKLPASVSVSGTSHTDSDLQPVTTYTYTVTAVNGGGESAHSQPVSVTTKDAWKCTETYTSNYTHVSQGRAYHALGYAKAKGSDLNMGLYTLFHYTRLANTKEGHYIIGACPK